MVAISAACTNNGQKNKKSQRNFENGDLPIVTWATWHHPTDGLLTSPPCFDLHARFHLCGPDCHMPPHQPQCFRAQLVFTHEWQWGSLRVRNSSWRFCGERKAPRKGALADRQEAVPGCGSSLPLAVRRSFEPRSVSLHQLGKPGSSRGPRNLL